MQHFDPELERRIRTFETTPDNDATFKPRDWFLLIALGIVFPAALLIWGWQR
ncbi:hypothetical protein [Hyphomicrobium sp. 802]|uniref:hypothetical protein n=1 Tax=Hyphomicrobium sp. 802 TaxID=1112272 RepID=UPI0002F5B7C4|nr:hypothetical protein [Hyphomicrobium sp. 802]